jgi:hypothetical protein
MSEADEKTTTEWMRGLLPEDKRETPFDQLTERDFGAMFAAAKIALGTDVRKYEHPQMKRGPDGRFKDSDLAQALMDASERPAHAFGARGIPSVMRAVEIMGEQWRSRVARRSRDLPHRHDLCAQRLEDVHLQRVRWTICAARARFISVRQVPQISQARARQVVRGVQQRPGRACELCVSA